MTLGGLAAGLLVAPLADDTGSGVDPHAWLSLANARLYVEAIAAGLAEADPTNAAADRAGADAYLERIAALDARTRALLGALPRDARLVVTSHDAFGYLAREWDLAFVAPQGIGATEPSARDVARLIRQVREAGGAALFLEGVGDPRLLERVAAETGARIGGTLYPDALTRPDGLAPTYLDLVRHNAETLAAALRP